MTGKSRLIQQLAQEGVFCMHLCLRKPGSAGYPERTASVCDWILGQCSSEVDFEKQLMAFHYFALNKFNRWLKEKIEEMDEISLKDLAIAWQEEQNNLWPDIVSDVLKKVEIVGDIEDLFVVYNDKLTKCCKKIADILSPYASLEEITVVFSWDEASALLHPDLAFISLSRFHFLRRAIQTFPRSEHCILFTVVTDTSSKISNFAPSMRLEPSGRGRAKGSKLFEPFWSIATLDVWPECFDYFSLGHLSDPEFYSIFGRPAFNAIFETCQNKTVARDYLFGILTQKLTFNLESDVTKAAAAKANFFNAAIAVLAVRVALDVSSSSRLASNLMATHMRFSVGVSGDRESVFTFQAAEPFLAYAAMRVTYMTGWTNLLSHLVDAMGFLYVDAGRRGEIAAQIIFLMVFDRLLVCELAKGLRTEKTWDNIVLHFHGSNKHLPALPLNDFMKILLGDDFTKIEEEADLTRKLSNLYIRLIQFVQMFKSPCKETLAQLFQRAAGMVCKFNEACVDLVVPFIRKPLNQRLEHIIVSPDIVGEFRVQVKCWEERQKPKGCAADCIEKMSRVHYETDCNNEIVYVCVYMDVGPRKNTTRRLYSLTNSDYNKYGLNKDELQVPLIIDNLRPSSILYPGAENPHEIDAVFDRLVRAGPDPLNNLLIDETTRGCVKEMLQFYAPGNQ